MPITRAYELMIIFLGDTEDEAVRGILAQCTSLTEAGGGKVATTDNWGRRRFAYEIDHKWEGVYVVLEIVTEASNLDDLERMLRLADEVVRHKLIRLPDREAAKRGLIGATPTPAG